ncbi:PTS sugar transporter subunit IIA [Numidum massiliense]|uniref:PTS sugar transporter subunit IIA n=1 Tax=Numidum massiliense TaxID=1522315 RepID=UPI0006D554CC|nr:PTS sugar transporter subunit IIA [Numidum massiliense]
MEIESLLNPALIKIDENLKTQKDVFARIAELAVVGGIASSKRRIVKGLLAREKEGTTGFLDGFAIPHTQVKDVLKPGIVIVRTMEGVEWQSMDGKPIRFTIALFVPEREAGSTHLTLLASLSRMLVHEEARERLLAAESAQEVYEQLRMALAATTD